MVFFSLVRVARHSDEDRVWVQRLCLALLFVLGAALGYIWALRCAEQSAPALSAYLDGYRRLLEEGRAGEISLFAAARLYLFVPVVLCLLGFLSVGVLLVPTMVAAFGFSSMFAVTCFLTLYGKDGVVLAFVAVGVRLLFQLPCILWLGAHAWAAASERIPKRGGKRVERMVCGSEYWLRFVVCVVLLLIGVAIERSVTSAIFQGAVKALT